MKSEELKLVCSYNNLLEEEKIEKLKKFFKKNKEDVYGISSLIKHHEEYIYNDLFQRENSDTYHHDEKIYETCYDIYIKLYLSSNEFIELKFTNIGKFYADKDIQV